MTIVTCVYAPEPVVSAQTSAQIAESLAERGHQVTVVTGFPNRPGGILFSGYQLELFLRHITPTGIALVRCFSLFSSNSSLLRRLLENVSFAITSAYQLATQSKPDVIYLNTWPIMAAGIASLVARLRRIPIVLSVQDVYPEVLVAQQRLAAGNPVVHLMRWIDAQVARNSMHVIVISEQFRKTYTDDRHVHARKLSLVPNWIDDSQHNYRVDGRAFRMRMGITDADFLLVYAGSVGIGAGVDLVIESLNLLLEHPSVRFVIAGAGSQIPLCHQLARDLPDGMVRFYSPWPVGETSPVLRSANLLVLPTKANQSLMSLPSKLLAYMLSGRPVLASADAGSDLTNLITQAECGWVVAPERPDLLAAQLTEILQLEPHELQRRGENGRKYALAHLTKSICLPEVIRILEDR